MCRPLAVFVLLFVVPACGKSNASSPESEGARNDLAVHVRTAPVTERPMPVYLTVTGSLRASEESRIAAEANGKVLQALVERGQAVRRGQVIATLDARSASLGATAAEAQSKLARTQLDQARRECERVRHLLDTGAISPADSERQTAQCAAQQWSLAAAVAQEQSASKLLGDTRIRAPFDGVIGEKMVNVGQHVEPNTNVATIYALDPLRLQLTIPELNLGAIKPDMQVSFTVGAFAEERFLGVVKFISPNVREASRDLVIEAVVPNRDGRLRPGMFAVAHLELSEQARAVVPLNAVARDATGDSASRVFVVAPDRKIQERLVQVGETKGDLVAILNGLRTGEAVVLQPGSDVRDGARVE